MFADIIGRLIGSGYSGDIFMANMMNRRNILGGILATAIGAASHAGPKFALSDTIRPGDVSFVGLARDMRDGVPQLRIVMREIIPDEAGNKNFVTMDLNRFLKRINSGANPSDANSVFDTLTRAANGKLDGMSEAMKQSAMAASQALLTPNIKVSKLPSVKEVETKILESESTNKQAQGASKPKMLFRPPVHRYHLQ
jgi:hypothetical protein